MPSLSESSRAENMTAKQVAGGVADSESRGARTSNWLSVLLLLATAVLSVGCGWQWTWPHTPFSKEGWQKSPQRERYRFYYDLKRAETLDRATRSTVIELLGEPDYSAPDGQFVDYVLKFAGTYELSMNAVYILRISFDSDERVSRYSVVTD